MALAGVSGIAAEASAFHRRSSSGGGDKIVERCRCAVSRGLESDIARIRHLLRGRQVRRSVSVSSVSASAATAAAAAAAHPAVASRSAEKAIQLPIDYYQVLGADSHFTSDAIIRAYESRVSNPPTDGFSQDVLRTRQQILKVARDTLADRDLRDEYDNGLKEDEAGTLVVEVPWSKIPGALCLLQEVGEAEVVLQAGEAVLLEQSKKQFRQDVVIVMALAYVELSREAMAEAPPAVVRSCDMLNAALKLLQEGGNLVASALQEQIYETLEEITPQCVLEVLSLPLDEDHKSQRAEALQEVRNILWTAGDGGLMAPVGRFTREQFMKETLPRMTASEQVALFTETPSSIPAEKLEVYSAALAHVALGFQTRKPGLIREASTLFSQLHQSMEHAMVDGLITDEQRDVILGRALSALLLGQVDSCKMYLGLDDRSPIRCPEVVDFVFSNSDENEDKELLSGMCKLLESWLSEEVFANFRETADSPATLGNYFDDPGVLEYLENLEKGGSSPLEAAAAIARMGAGATAALDSVFGKVFPLRKVAKMPQRGNQEDSRSGSEAALSDDTYDEKSVSSYDEQASERPKKAGLKPLQVVCVGALLGGIALAGFQYPALRKSWREIPSTRGGTESTVKEVARMDARLAEVLIRKWQGVKSQALGVNHAVTQLSEILDGQMLKSWTERAMEVARQGWYWEYHLLNLSVDSVTISQDGRRAMVEATLQEAARLFSPKPSENDSYRSSYTTRYDLLYRDTSGWKITGGVLLRT